MRPSPAILVFDIETIPDLTAGRRLYPSLEGATDADALTALMHMRQSEVGNPFMPLPLHQIVCLSTLWVQDGQMQLCSMSAKDHEEGAIIARFFEALNQKPTLVSFNGKGFDIPVISYRALKHRLSSFVLYDQNSTTEVKYNNYQNRYHDRHFDVMRKLAHDAPYQKLDVLSCLCGISGKQDINGAMVAPLVAKGDFDTLMRYCESDVLNTWLLYLRAHHLYAQNLPFGHPMALEQQTLEYLLNLTEASGQLRHQKFLEGWELYQSHESAGNR